MSSTGVRRTRSTESRVADSILDEDRIQIEQEKVYPVEGDNNSNTPGIANIATPAGNFLLKDGDIREGQFGNDFGIVVIEGNQINVSQSSGNFKPVVIVNGEGGADDILDSILPGTDVFFNNELMLHIGFQTITIHEDLARPQHILTPGSVDVVLPPGAYAKVIYSHVLFAWVLVWSSSVTSGGSPLTTKGDIFGFDTADNRIPVGADNLPLVADSTTALGVGYEILKIAGGGTGLATYAEGDILFGQASGNNLGKLAIGGVNEFLHGGTVPSWSTIALNQLSNVNVPTPGVGNVLTFNGSLWINQAPSGASPLTTKGDIFGFDTSDNRIPVGADNLPLVADSTTALGVGYEILKIAGGGTGLATYAEGDILFGQASGNNLGKLAIGGVNEFLHGGTVPSWSTIALNQLSNVNVPTPGVGNVLTFNGSLWINQAPSGASPLTTKGDIFGFDTADNRIPVGSNDLPLVADSTTALGVGYEILKIAGGGTGLATYAEGDILFGQASGNNLGKLAIGTANRFLRSSGTLPEWETAALDDLSDVILTSPIATNVLTFNGSAWINQAPQTGSGAVGTQDGTIWKTTSTTIPINNRVYMSNCKQGYLGTGLQLPFPIALIEYVPIFIGETVNVIELGFVHTTLLNGNINVLMGIYENRTDGSNYPGAFKIGGGLNNFAVGAADFIRMSVTSTTLTPGLYWIALLFTNFTIESTVTISSHDSFAGNSVGFFDSGSGTQIKAIQGYTLSGVALALPTNAATNMPPTDASPAALFARFNP